MSALKVYLCDLTHETVILVSDSIPVNIGYIGAYAKKVHGSDIDISLFKYPESAIAAIKSDPPDILALSNYSWNSNLSERMARLAKSINPDVVTVQGGTNFPHASDQQVSYMNKKPATDFFVELEGEVSFSNLITRVIESRDGGPKIFDVPVDGCVFIHPDTRENLVPDLVAGTAPDRLRNLDEIPSPYLTGLLDGFFDGRLLPFLETNRGCPFKCSFCHTGADYFGKINLFSLDRIKEELKYAGRKAQQAGVTGLIIADTNFGMFPRDREICEALLETQKSFGWPLNIISTTGKNNKERVIDITGILGDTFDITMSVQSMDETVLSNINRSNIKLDDYMGINEHLRQQGRSTTGEMILGLPGETKTSFKLGVEKIISSGVSVVTVYSLMMLYGTEFQDPKYRDKFAYDGRYRIVPLNFGEYDGERIFDYEEVGIASKDLSFDDYLELRRFALVTETLHNNRPFEAFFRYAISLGQSRFQFLNRVFNSLEDAPEEVRKVVDNFMAETRSELWPSDTDMINHYQQDDNYQNLLAGEVGGNLIYKYKSMSLALTIPHWIAFLITQLKQVAIESLGDTLKFENACREIEAIAEFSRKKTWRFLEQNSGDEIVSMKSDFDFVTWLDSPEDEALSSHAVTTPIEYFFEFTEDQKRSRDEAFHRFGTDVNGLSKIVTRLVLQTLFRKVRSENSSDDTLSGTVKKARTQYALAN
jgi:radical SAM superfamily enzyme YgiQ (UPF0313 family)